MVRGRRFTSLRILDGVLDGRIRRRGRADPSSTATGSPRGRSPASPSTMSRCGRRTRCHSGRRRGVRPRRQPILIVDRLEAPTAHDEIVAYCRAMGATPRWMIHAAVQVERVLDLVAVGTGIGWLNSWQAERARGAPTSPSPASPRWFARRAPSSSGAAPTSRRRPPPSSRRRSVLPDRPDRVDPRGRVRGAAHRSAGGGDGLDRRPDAVVGAVNSPSRSAAETGRGWR